MNYEIEEFSVEDICKRWTDGQLKVDHEYQRAPRWMDRQKQLLIDSVLRGYALPLFFLHRKKRGFGHQTIEEWFIVDGQQRIQSLADYKAGNFGLLDPAKNRRWFPKFIADSEVPCGWANRNYSQLDRSQREDFNSTRLRVILIDAGEDEVRDLFVRLQAGSPLRPQDKRDAFPGGMPIFIKHLGGYVDRGDNQEVKVSGGHPIFDSFLKWSTPATTHLARELAAKIVMQLERDHQGVRLSATNSLALDAFYHEYVNFSEASDDAKRLEALFDDVYDSLSQYNGALPTPMEWVHIFLLWQRLQNGYTNTWKKSMKQTLRKFKRQLANAQADPVNRASDPFWTEFGMLRAGRAQTVLLSSERGRSSLTSGSRTNSIPLRWMTPERSMPKRATYCSVCRPVSAVITIMISATVLKCDPTRGKCTTSCRTPKVARQNSKTPYWYTDHATVILVRRMFR